MASDTMRAWTHDRSGHPSKVLALSSDIRIPFTKHPTDVLVRVSYAALHPGTSIIMQLCPYIFRSKLSIPETEFSGTIIATRKEAEESRNLVPGTPVFGSVSVGPHVRTTCGALAEYVVVDASSVVKKPDNVSFEQAAGLPVSGCTALALLEKAKLKKGDSVLVNGASGGVGHFVVQLAKHAVGESGKVVAICSGKNSTLARELGADEVIDYQNHAPVHQYLSKNYSNSRFDVIIDAYGIQELYIHCSEYLAEGKPFVSVGTAATKYTVSSLLYTLYVAVKNILLPRVLGGVGRPFVQVAVAANLKDVEKLSKLVEEGNLKVVVDSCWEMGDALKAYEIMLSHRTRGKVVVKVTNE